MNYYSCMKNSICLLAWICILPVLSTAQLINNGASIVVSSGTNLVLDNISLQNNGSFNQVNGTVKFTGNAGSFIGGSNRPGFSELLLDKPGATLQLQTGILINSQLFFNNGLVDLNGNIVSLNIFANLVNENEVSHIMGTSGYVEASNLFIAPVTANLGRLGAIITSSQNLGLVTIRRGHQSQTNSGGGGNSILRYFDIIPANNTALTATLRFEYLDAELNGLDENLLTVWKRNGVQWTNLDRVSNNTIDNYVEQSGLNDFTRFTLSTPNNALPVIWGSFNTQCVSNHVRISWKTEQEQNTSSFIIRRSPNGSDWTVIHTLAAAGNSNVPITYLYTDPNPLPGTTYYQVQQRDKDGRLTASPVLSNNCGIQDGLKLYPNPVLNNCWVSIHTARAGFVILRLYDGKGALVQQRRATIQNGNNILKLQMERFTPGMYSLTITLPEGAVRTIKIKKGPF
jgi:hypothetical protein